MVLKTLGGGSLAGVRCLDGADPAKLLGLLADLEHHEAPAGTLLGREGQTRPAVFTIVHGMVRLARPGPRRSVPLWIGLDGDCFCLTPPCVDVPSPFDAECLVPTHYVVVPAERWERLFCEPARLHRNVARCLAEERVALADRAEQLVGRPVEERLLDLLRRLAERGGTERDGEIELRDGVTREVLAAALGSAPEVVSRALGRLEEKGVLRRGRAVIRLRSVADGAPGGSA